MVEINPYREDSREILEKSLTKLDELISEKQDQVMSNIPKSVNPDLISKEFYQDSMMTCNILGMITKDSWLPLNLPEIAFDIMRSGLLLYQEDLEKVAKISNSQDIQSEISEVVRILNLPYIKDSETTFYEKYNQDSNNEDISEISTDELIETLERINVVAKQKIKTRLFKNNAKSIKDLNYKCEDEAQFVYKIAIIANLVGEIYQDEIKNITSIEGISGSINILEKVFSEIDENYNKQPFEILRKLTKLRSTKMPIHSGEHEAMKILEDLGIPYPIDYREAGRIIFIKYNETMKEILIYLENLKKI